MSLKGIYHNKEDNNIKIIIERDYKKKDTVNYFYFMCDKTGVGILLKEDLIKNWTKEK